MFVLLFSKSSQCFLDSFVPVDVETNPEEPFMSSLNNETPRGPVCSLSICDTACLGICMWKRPKGEQRASISLLASGDQLN